MSEVRPRTRRSSRVKRVQEIQGMLAMQGWVSEAEHESTNMTEPAPTRPTTSGDVLTLPYRKVLADWPDDWRERWGRRANDLEDSGLSWRDAEGRAFVETWTSVRAADGVERN